MNIPSEQETAAVWIAGGFALPIGDHAFEYMTFKQAESNGFAERTEKYNSAINSEMHQQTLERLERDS
jgi:hypothetical protein